MWKFRYSPAPNMRDWPADVKAKVTHVVLGLAQQSSQGGGYMQYQPDWGQSVEDHAADIREFRSRGCNVVMGFGGGGGSIAIQNETQVTQAMSSITGFVNTYSINGIDLDMEPSGSSWNQASIVSLFTQCKTKWGQNFICGITPGLYSSYTDQWFALVKALGPSRYDYFAPMEYDYPESQDSRLLGIWAYKVQWMIDAGIPANKIIMGCMMQPTAGYSATINPQTILDAWNQEVAKRPTLRGIFEWEDKIAKQRNWDLVRKMIAAGKP
jgi:chitinase